MKKAKVVVEAHPIRLTGSGERVEVDALVDGDLAIHRGIGMEADGKFYTFRLYTVTHIPSGMAQVYSLSLQQARKYVEEFKRIVGPGACAVQDSNGGWLPNQGYIEAHRGAKMAAGLSIYGD